MQIKFCLVNAKDSENGTNLGYAYIKSHESELKDAPDGVSDYLAAGYVQGVDFVVYDNVAYMLKKTFILGDQDMVVHLAVESVRGCDIVNT